MTEAVQNNIIAALVPAITAIGVIIVALRQGRTSKKVDDLHIIVNSRLTELLKVTSDSQLAKGKIEGKNEEKIASIGRIDATNAPAPVSVKIEAPSPVPVVVVETKAATTT